MVLLNNDDCNDHCFHPSACSYRWALLQCSRSRRDGRGWANRARPSCRTRRALTAWDAEPVNDQLLSSPRADSRGGSVGVGAKNGRGEAKMFQGGRGQGGRGGVCPNWYDSVR